MSKLRLKGHVSRDKDGDELSFLGIVKSCFLFLAFFCALSFVLILVTSLIIFRLEDPTAYLGIVGKAVLYFSAFISCFTLSKRNQQRYVPCAIVLGAMITALIFILSLIYPNSNGNNTLWLALIPAATLLGGLLGIKRTTKPHKHKKHR